MTGKIWLIFFLAAIASLPANSDDLPVVKLSSGWQYIKENLRPNAPVSGGDIFGLGFPSDSGEKGASAIYVKLPRDLSSSKRLCVEITSRDGLYVASDDFELPRSATFGIARLDFNSHHPEIFSQATHDTLGITAHLGSCGGKMDSFLPVMWRGLPGNYNSNDLLVAVQSGNSRARLHVSDDSGKPLMTVSCDSVQGDNTIAFDRICKIPDFDKASSKHVTLKIERCSFGDCNFSPAWSVSP